MTDTDSIFFRELTALLNSHSKESASDTPDYILATYLMGCLDALNAAIFIREEHYGRRTSDPETGKERENGRFT